MMSEEAPGAKGTTSRTGLLGYESAAFCAQVDCADVNAIRQAKTRVEAIAIRMFFSSAAASFLPCDKRAVPALRAW
jgi:hypothetical protein